MIADSRFNENRDDDRYQRAVHDIFDYIRNVGMQEGLSMDEVLGVLTVVRGSLELNLALKRLQQYNEAREKESEDEDE